MSDDKMVQVSFTVPQHIKEAADTNAEYGEKSEVLRNAMARMAGGEELSKREHLTKRLEEITEEKDSIQKQIRQLEAEYDELEKEERRKQNALEELRTEEQEYREKLAELEGSLYSGARVTVEWKQVNRAAAIAEKDAEEVIDDLKERNPGVPPWAYQSKLHTRREWNGMDADDAKHTEFDEDEWDERGRWQQA